MSARCDNVRRWGTIFTLALVALLIPGQSASPSSLRGVDGRIADWVGTAPLVGGESAVSKGEFVHQDYLFDDAGGDAGSPNNGNTWYYRGISEPTGDYLYPNETKRCRNNCADLLEFRAELDGDRVRFLVKLNTLLTKDSTVVAIALGRFGEKGKAHLWPFQANVSSPGTRNVLTLWGTGGAFDEASLASVGGKVAVDVQANAIEASLPAELVGTRFRAYVGTGLWDPEVKQWKAIHNMRTPEVPGLRQAYDGIDHSPPAAAPLVTLPRVFDLGFNENDLGNWFEDKQGTALTEGDLSRFHADVDLRANDRAPDPFVPGKWVQRMYESSVKIPPGEGVYANFPAVEGRGFYCCSPAGVPVPTRFHFLGRRQPYALYVPKGGYERAILANHPGLTSHGASTTSDGYKKLAEKANAVMVTPLARGVISFCTDWAHLDVLEAWDDALSLFPHGPGGRRKTAGSFIDTDRNMLWGYSMGGLCTARLAVLHPDRFASAVQWAAATAFEEDHEPVDSKVDHPGNGNPIDLLQNTRGVTWRINHCAADDIAHYPGVVPQAQRLEELGYIYNFRTLFGCDHIVAPREYPEDAQGTAAAVIDPDPARVTYRTAQAWWRPDISNKLVFDRAYWVSGLRTRDRSAGLKAYGTVDAVTRGLRGERRFATEPYGPNHGVMGTFPYEEHGRRQVAARPVKKANEFDATLTNLRTTTFDLDRMGLTINTPLTATLATDGEVEVELAGAAGAHLVDCKPAPCPAAAARPDGRDLVIALREPGEFVLTLARGRDRGQAGTGQSAQGQAGGRERGVPAGGGAPALRAAAAADRGSALALTGADIVALVVLGLLLTFTGMAMTRLRHERTKWGEPA